MQFCGRIILERLCQACVGIPVLPTIQSHCHTQQKSIPSPLRSRRHSKHPRRSLLQIFGWILEKFQLPELESLFDPFAKIPMREQVAQFISAVYLEFAENITDMCLDRAGRDHEPLGDLLIGKTQTNQGGYIPLPR